MIMSKLFVFPSYNTSENAYLSNFYESLFNAGYTIRNRVGIIKTFSVLFNLDAKCFIFHWVDTIPFSKYGFVQAVFLIIILPFLPLLGKQIIWVLHNKEAHKGTSRMGELLMASMAKYSTQVIVHSADGVDFFNSKYPAYGGKCRHVPHPVYTTDIYKSDEIKWDFICWGNLDPRKGVDDFLVFAENNPYFKNKKILICGRCKDNMLDSKIKELSNDNVTYINRFVSDDEIRKYISQSKIILFTYTGNSVLSSGALVYSLNFGKPIIGPSLGNFKDYPDMVFCYKEYSDIINIAKNQIDAEIDDKILKRFLEENSWDKFPRKLFL